VTAGGAGYPARMRIRLGAIPATMAAIAFVSVVTLAAQPVERDIPDRHKWNLADLYPSDDA